MSSSNKGSSSNKRKTIVKKGHINVSLASSSLRWCVLDPFGMTYFNYQRTWFTSRINKILNWTWRFSSVSRYVRNLIFRFQAPAAIMLIYYREFYGFSFMSLYFIYVNKQDHRGHYFKIVSQVYCCIHALLYLSITDLLINSTTKCYRPFRAKKYTSHDLIS